MKIADLMMMDKRIINELKESLKNLSDEDLNKLKLVSLGASLLADMICEIMDGDAISNSDLSPNDRALIMLQIISSGTATALLKLGYKTGNLEMTINGFKHYFEKTIERMEEMS